MLSLYYSMNHESIVLAGGCFWCIEAVFQRIDGVVSATSGYMGGHVVNPDYQSVCGGETGHAEVVKVVFYADQISLSQILQVFWLAHDPTTLNRQGADVGTQYRSAVFFDGPEQEQVIKESIDQLVASGKYKGPIVTQVVPLDVFYPAETYHENYYSLNPNQGYCAYVIQPKLDKLGLL